VRHEFRLVRTNVKFVEAFKKALEKVKSASENQVPNESAPSSPSKSRTGYVGSLEDGKGVLQLSKSDLFGTEITFGCILPQQR